MRLKLSDMKDERKICYKKMGYSWSTKCRRPSVLEDIRVSTEALHHDRPWPQVPPRSTCWHVGAFVLTAAPLFSLAACVYDRPFQVRLLPFLKQFIPSSAPCPLASAPCPSLAFVTWCCVASRFGTAYHSYFLQPSVTGGISAWMDVC